MMKVAEIAAILDRIAPPWLAEEWDNVGLLVGDATGETGKLMLCIDLTPAVLEEAIRAGAGMVMAYHSIIFKPVSRLTAQSHPVAYAAARAGIAVHSMHTALDAAPGGTNDVLADAMGLTSTRPIVYSHRKDHCKIVVFTPADDLSRVAEAAFSAGAGRMGEYYDCSFFGHGVGTFCGTPGTRPAIGRPGRHEAVEELRLEVIVPCALSGQVVEAIRAAHSYEEPAIDVYDVSVHPEGAGQGRVGRLQKPVSAATLISRIKKALGVRRVQVAGPAGSRRVETAACCAGSGGDFLAAAMSAGATFYLTGEIRHHGALAAAAGGATVVCVGHSNSERITLGHLAKQISAAAKGLKVVVSKRDKDPMDVV